MTNESTDFELADATHVRVLETNLLHASDAIFWLDASSAEDAEAMSRIQHPLEILFLEKPKAVKHLHSLGKTAFWKTPTEPMHEGVTTDNQRARPVQTPFVVSGRVNDPLKRFNPAAFEVNLGSGNGHSVMLYPTPFGVKTSSAGAVYGRVCWAADERPLIWGMLLLEITVGLGEIIRFRAQTDANGDFRLSLNRLPPLPLSATEFSATLTIEGDTAAEAATPLDVSSLVSLALESATAAGNFAEQMALEIQPGFNQRIQSADRLFIAVQINP
jgi:hypothetical protein